MIIGSRLFSALWNLLSFNNLHSVLAATFLVIDPFKHPTNGYTASCGALMMILSQLCAICSLTVFVLMMILWSCPNIFRLSAFGSFWSLLLWVSSQIECPCNRLSFGSVYLVLKSCIGHFSWVPFLVKLYAYLSSV